MLPQHRGIVEGRYGLVKPVECDVGADFRRRVRARLNPAASNNVEPCFADKCADCSPCCTICVDEAGNEKELLKRLGSPGVLVALLELYRRGFNFARAYQLAESRAEPALGADPTGRGAAVLGGGVSRGLRGPGQPVRTAGGNPGPLLHAMTRKESGFDPPAPDGGVRRADRVRPDAEYLKRVVSIYARYRYLYGPSPHEILLSSRPSQ